ncbi:hypothetical protein [Croceimicrobium sp.]|uniref:hypothetical protein n=1 Tax=Croceimicrobium sp. TaxID=2828340 RepID=UPI003BA87C70
MKFIKDHLLSYKAKSRQHFYQLLIENGFTITTRQGLPTGIEDTNGRRYSWKSLGITPADFIALEHREQLNRFNQRLERLEQLRSGKEQERDRNL